MPNRILREGINDSRAVNSLTEAAELFYRHLISIVDDYGRCEADVQMLRVRCFPRRLDAWTAERITAAMAETAACISDKGEPLVSYYSWDSHEYLQVNNFHQRSRYAEKSKSKFPDATGRYEVPMNGRHASGTRQADARSRDVHARVFGAEAEAGCEAGAGGGASPPPGELVYPWHSDPGYAALIHTWRGAHPESLPEDFERNYPTWLALGETKQKKAVANLIEGLRVGAKPSSSLAYWLKEDYKRVVVPDPRKAGASADGAKLNTVNQNLKKLEAMRKNASRKS